MTRKTPCSAFRIAAVSAFAMTAAHTAYAQEAPDTVRLPELTITGGKRD